MRGGKTVFSEAQTFDGEKAARAWLDRMETRLAEPGGIEAARNRGITLADAIDRYLSETEGRYGTTKQQVMRTIKAFDFAATPCAAIRSDHIVAFARELAVGRQPQTVGNYLSHLQALFKLAKPAWGYPLDYAEMQSAMVAIAHLKISSRSKQRTRRPTLEELDRLMEFFGRRPKRAIPMQQIVVFALYSTRRLEEITRMKWDDLETDRILVRDMKDPREKEGNHVWCELPPEARRVIDAMPRRKPEIFPYHKDTVSINFTRACKVLGIEDLHLHDLRHEGITRLIEMGRTIPMAASVSGHRNWQTLQRYTHVRKAGDKYEGWKWLDVVAPP